MSGLRVTTGAQAGARDLAAIRGGTESFVLMARAGSAATEVLLRDYSNRLADGVAIYAGAGNNGGDAYIVAAQLARAGVTVRLHATATSTTPDARRAASIAAPLLTAGAPTGAEQLVVDGLLGTGHRGALRAAVALGCARIRDAQRQGAVVVALDLPSGLEADTGIIAEGSVAASCTVAFGTIKRGVLLQRAHTGQLVVVDIGLGDHAMLADDAWQYLHGADIASRLPLIAWDAHKARRGRVALGGGQRGMAGAIVLAARAALAAGAGLVHAVVDTPSVSAVQQLVPQALAHAWPRAAGGDDESRSDGEMSERFDEHDAASMQQESVHQWGGDLTPAAVIAAILDDDMLSRDPEDAVSIYHAIGLGPGLGRTPRSARALATWLAEHRTAAMVFDADALWLAAEMAQEVGGDAASLIRHWSRHARAVVCTPHPGEFARLIGAPLPATWSERAEALHQFADRAQATVLLKGTPTLIATPRSSTHVMSPLMVVPHGTALLATGGSGDLLTGIITALLGQGLSGPDAALCGATAHGLAAEIATASLGGVRGGTLHHVLAALPAAWRALEQPAALPPHVLATLAAPVV